MLQQWFKEVGITRDRIEHRVAENFDLYHDLEIAPIDFLQHAHDNLTHGLEPETLLSLSSTWHAVTAQTDEFLGALGLLSRNATFVQKADLLRSLGIPVPGILDWIRRARNRLEHEHTGPSVGDLRGAYDVALLYMMALKGLMRSFWGSFDLAATGEGVGAMFSNVPYLRFAFQPGQSSYEVTLHTTVILEETYVETKPQRFTIDASNPFYRDCVRIALSDRGSIPTSDALQMLLNTVEESSSGVAG